jgi:hypothetical protein
MAMARLALYCVCGAAWSGTVESVKAPTIRSIWQRVHDGPGHGPATAAQARRARGKDGSGGD